MIQGGVTGEVVCLDVDHVDGLADLAVVELVQVTTVLADVGIVTNAADVALKIDHVHLVEAAQCHEEARSASTN